MARRHSDDIGLFFGTSSKRACPADRGEKLNHCRWRELRIAFMKSPIALHVTPVTLARDKCHGRPSRTGVRYKDRLRREAGCGLDTIASGVRVSRAKMSRTETAGLNPPSAWRMKSGRFRRHLGHVTSSIDSYGFSGAVPLP